MDFLRENGAHVAAWLPLFFAALALVVLLLFFRALRMRSRWRMTTALMALGGAVAVLIVMFGPMAPLFTSARRLDSWTGRTAPHIAFRDVASGKEHNLAAYRGRVVVVNLWATWCPPCREEMPTLNRLQKAHGSRGLVVMTLSDESPDRVAPFLASHAPDTLNGVATFDWLPIQNFRPFTFIVDRNGVVREYFFGAQEYEAFDAKVRLYL